MLFSNNFTIIHSDLYAEKLLRQKLTFASLIVDATFNYFQIERIGLVSTTSQKCNSQELTIKCEFLEIPPVNVDNEFNVTFFDKEMNYYEYNAE